MRWADLTTPYQYEFFRNGVIVAVVAGGLCGLIGVYVVLRGMSYIGHGLSHAIFGGYAASGLLGVNVFLGAGAWGVASALMVSVVTRRRIIGSDAAIGVITTASFAIGLVLIQVRGSPGRNPDAALFGNVLGVGPEDVWVVIGVALFAAAVIFLRYRTLLFTTFDPEVAHASGVDVARADAVLMVVMAASILATLNVMGVTLVAAAIVVPATIARLLTSSFSRMLALATLIGSVSAFVGMNLSYHLDIASGPMIVLTGTVLFAIAFAGTARQRSSRRHARLALGDRAVRPPRLERLT